jgi:hypothetical protein
MSTPNGKNSDGSVVAVELRRLLGAQAGAATDPLLAAIIAKLPAAGEDFTPAAREAWLQLMAMGFDLVYGGAAGGGMSSQHLSRSIGQRAPAKTAPAAKAGKAKPRSGKPPLPKVPMPEFYIDKDGYARNERGDRVKPGDVAGILTDFRGASGDLATIIWADGKRGIPRGMQLDIHGAADPRD